MKQLKPIIAILTGVLILGSCSKKTYEPEEQDATAQISVFDDKNVPLGGIPVLIYDEKGYEKFQKDRTTPPAAFTLTLPDGKVNYRLPFAEWFASGERFITFVVREDGDAENFRVWAIGRTVHASERVDISFRLKENPLLPE